MAGAEIDSQILELLGRNQLINELLRARLEVALPLRDHGIDLIAYADLGPGLVAIVGCPIQMKASLREGFSVDAKYAKFPNLLLAYVWNIEVPLKQTIFAMTYQEANTVADQMGWTKTASWRDGSYTTTAPSAALRALLEPHRMTPERWWQKVTHLGPPSA